MSGTDDLKSLLARLKGEVSPSSGPDLPSEPSSWRGSERGAGAPGPVNRDSPPPRPGQPQRPEFIRPDRGPAAANQIWSENKETMLFGMLASVIVLLGGLAASLLWLTAIGAAFFVLFAAVMAAVLSGYARNFRPAAGGGDSAELSAKLEQLARKVDSLALRGGAAQNGSSGAFRGGDRELERKVEELRILVRSLTKSAGLE